MTRVLITGMSGAGKSSAVSELAGRGYDAIDLATDEWCEWVMAPRNGDAFDAPERPDWIWKTERVRRHLAAARAGAVFIAGCASNQGRCYDLLDHVVLLTAPVDVLLARVTLRTNNPYGTRAEARDEIVQYVREVEPLLRRGATRVWDTSTSTVSGIADRLLKLVTGER